MISLSLPSNTGIDFTNVVTEDYLQFTSDVTQVLAVFEDKDYLFDNYRNAVLDPEILSKLYKVNTGSVPLIISSEYRLTFWQQLIYIDIQGFVTPDNLEILVRDISVPDDLLLIIDVWKFVSPIKLAVGIRGNLPSTVGIRLSNGTKESNEILITQYSNEYTPCYYS